MQSLIWLLFSFTLAQESPDSSDTSDNPTEDDSNKNQDTDSDKSQDTDSDKKSQTNDSDTDSDKSQDTDSDKSQDTDSGKNQDTESKNNQETDSLNPLDTNLDHKSVVPKSEMENAESLSDLSKEELSWLKPLPQRFRQHPYQHVDFTSYTLEWGEFQVGLNTLKVGALPRTQLGTSIPMWIIGLQNAEAKVNLFRVGAFDVGLDANWLSLPTDDFRMTYLGMGANSSIRIMEPWTVHIGSQYASFSANGLPDLDAVNPFILDMSGIDADAYRDSLDAEGVRFDLSTGIVILKLATDFRLNRRDSWIFQAQGIIWHSINSSSNFNDSEDIPYFLNVDAIFALESQGFSDITKSYVVSIAHQWSWNHSYLRMGIGWSSMEEYAFAPAILQTIDYAWRFGGKTKVREGKIRKGWRDNKKRSDNPESEQN